MPDTINHTIDLKASMQQVYDWSEDPTAGLLFAPVNEVSDVVRDAHGRMASFKTKRGTVQFRMHEYPQRWEAEYCWRGFRTRYETRVQRYGEAWVRLTVDINIQPRSFMARLSGSRVRSSFNHRLTQCLAAAGAIDAVGNTDSLGARRIEVNGRSAAGKDLQHLAGTILPEDAGQMREVIEQGCEQVDEREW